MFSNSDKLEQSLNCLHPHPTTLHPLLPHPQMKVRLINGFWRWNKARHQITYLKSISYLLYLTLDLMWTWLHQQFLQQIVAQFLCWYIVVQHWRDPWKKKAKFNLLIFLSSYFPSTSYWYFIVYYSYSFQNQV